MRHPGSGSNTTCPQSRHLLDDHQIVNTGITESRSSEHAAKATAYDEDFHLSIDRLTLEAGST